VSVSFNLVDEPWIPVLWVDGKPCREGIKGALTRAGTIRQIAASNPMDNVALLRLLLAVLQWCKPEVRRDELDKLREGGARGMPEEWLKKLEASKAKFELLGNGERFYQAISQANETPRWKAADLFADLPGGTEINHFRHVCDRSVALCPACCVLGLVQLTACATAGGSGLSPSINNAPPIYFVPVGDTLLETLVLNWPMESADNDHPAWEEGKCSSRNIGILEGLTWQPRAIWLGTPVQEGDGSCARCGATGLLVSRLVFKKGRRRADDSRDWRDPHLAWDEHSEKDDKALRGPDPLQYSQAAAVLWRKEVRAILESLDPSNNHPSIPAVAQAINRVPQHAPLRISCFEPFTKPGQKKWFDEDGHMWRIASGLLRSTDLPRRALAELDWLGRLRPDKMLSQALRRNAKQRPDVRAALADAAAQREGLLRNRFQQLLEELARADGDEATRWCMEDWRTDVKTALLEELSQACGVIAPGSPLRRREAVRAVEHELDKAVKKAAADEAIRSSPHDAAKPKRRRGKGGES